MRDRLPGLLEKADLALGSSADVIEEEKLDPLIEAVKAVRTRLAYPEDVLVVALAGGTGSGKSSLFNAICGEELVEVGGIRPTTSQPTAAIPADVGSAMDGYLDRLGVVERHHYHGPGICLIDLPDSDSVEGGHRRQVDWLLPLVDVVVWVTDPEKYRDARLHEEYLKPMASHAAQFVVVINQIDRLSPSQLDQVRGDLEVALLQDGLEGVSVISTAAAHPSGPPMGIEDLIGTLQARVTDRDLLYDKLLVDVAATARSLEAETGNTLDFDSRARAIVGPAAESLAEGDTEAATYVMTKFLDGLAGQSGGLTAVKIQSVAAVVPAHVQRIEGQLGTPQPSERRRWFPRRSVQEDDSPDRVEQARSLLSEAVIRPVRAVLARRALALASVAEFALEVESLRSAQMSINQNEQ